MSKKQSHITKRRREQVALLAFSGQNLSLAQIAEQVQATGIPCSPQTVMRDLEIIEKEAARTSEADLPELRQRAIATLEAKIAELQELKTRAPRQYYDLWLKYRIELHRVLGVRAASKVDITVSRKPLHELSYVELIAVLLEKLSDYSCERAIGFIQQLGREDQKEEEGLLLEGEVEEPGLPKPHVSHHGEEGGDAE